MEPHMLSLILSLPKVLSDNEGWFFICLSKILTILYICMYSSTRFMSTFWLITIFFLFSFFVHFYARFKLILGYLQLDNQLPLTLMPVLLAPEQASDLNHPVFKMTVTVSNRSLDGIQIYPYIYIRVRSPSLF